MSFGIFLLKISNFIVKHEGFIKTMDTHKYLQLTRVYLRIKTGMQLVPGHSQLILGFLSVQILSSFAGAARVVELCRGGWGMYSDRCFHLMKQEALMTCHLTMFTA